MRDRIKELRRVPASRLKPHPRNWRTHPGAQRHALMSLLQEIGCANALLVRELPDGALQLLDGHLRADLAADAEVPVLVLDVNEAEAEKILLTHDPVAGMAGCDEERLRPLLKEVEMRNSELRAFIAALPVTEQEEEAASDDQDVVVMECYQVVVECCDEEEQQDVYHRMRQDGYRCRVLTL